MLTKQQIEALYLKPSQVLIGKKNKQSDISLKDKYLILDGFKGIEQSNLTEKQQERKKLRYITKKPVNNFLQTVMRPKTINPYFR